jgi:hypothetical protein
MNAFDIGLRERLALYMTDQMSLSDFRRWFLPLVWDLSEDGQLRSPLARRVELRLAEFMNGHWTEDDLKLMFTREVPITGSLSPMFRPVLSGVRGAGEPARPPVAPQRGHVAVG